MQRTVVTEQDVAKAKAGGKVAAGGAPPPGTPDTYKDRLLKYIPAEIVAIYLGLLNLAKLAKPGTTPIITVEWIVFAAIFIVTIPWQLKVMRVTKWQQIAITTTAFVVWAISLGDPFDSSWKHFGYQPLFGTMVLMLYTFLIPLFEAEG